MSYPNAAHGLKTVYQSQLIGIIAAVLMFIPVINILAAIAIVASLVLYMVGLNQTAKDDAGYRTAFTLVIAQLVVSLLGNIIGGSTFGSILSLVNDVLALAVLYYVCTTTNRLLQNVCAPESVTTRGTTVWKINVICTIVEVVCGLLAMIPSASLQLLASFVTLLAAIAQLVGTILYILYLRDAYRALETSEAPHVYVGPEV